MNKIINYLKSISFFSILLLFYVIVISILYYFELFSYNTLNIINFIVIIILFFILGYKISNLERKKGYLNGFLVSSVLVILFSLISLIFFKLEFSSLVYYLSLIVSSIIGGIFGVSNK